MKYYDAPSAELLLLNSVEDVLLASGYVGDGTITPEEFDGGSVANSVGSAPNTWWK